MMRVWIDQDLCTGDAQCVEICPDVFSMVEDDLGYRAYVDNADVPSTFEHLVVEAAELCPGECIFVERSTARGLGPHLTRA